MHANASTGYDALYGVTCVDGPLVQGVVHTRDPELLTRLVNGWPQAHIAELMPWHRATPKPA